MHILGKNESILQLMDWVKNFYSGDREFHHAILLSNSGDGKTFLCSEIAKENNATIFRITPEDVTSSDDINQLVKSINLTDMFDNSTKKLIVIDDFDEFKWNYRDKLSDIPSQSNHPVIFTCKDESRTYSKILKGDITKYALKVQNKNRMTPYIKKIPREHEKFQLLLSLNTNKSRKELLYISKHSKSIRSAIITAKYSSEINFKDDTNKSSWDVIRDMKNRSITSPI